MVIELKRISILFIILSLLFVLGCGTSGRGSASNENSNKEISTDWHSTTSIPGSVTLLWDAPTTNSDGSTLTDLAGYKVYIGSSTRNYSQSIDIGNFTGTIINNLSSGTWCFAVTAYDTSGNESTYSNEVCKII